MGHPGVYDPCKAHTPFRGLGFRVWDLGFRVEGLGFRVLGFRISGLV